MGELPLLLIMLPMLLPMLMLLLFPQKHLLEHDVPVVSRSRAVVEVAVLLRERRVAPGPRRRLRALSIAAVRSIIPVVFVNAPPPE